MVEAYLADRRQLFGGEGAFYWVVKLTDKDMAGGSDERLGSPDDDGKSGHDNARFSLWIAGTDGYFRISYGPVKKRSWNGGLKVLRDLLV